MNTHITATTLPRPLTVREYSIMQESQQLQDEFANAETPQQKAKILAKWNAFTTRNKEGALVHQTVDMRLALN